MPWLLKNCRPTRMSSMFMTTTLVCTCIIPLEDPDFCESCLSSTLHSAEGPSTEAFYTELPRALTFLGDGHTGISHPVLCTVKRLGNRTHFPSALAFCDTVYISALKQEAVPECLFTAWSYRSMELTPDSTLRHMCRCLTCADNQNHTFKQAFTERTFEQESQHFFGATACVWMVCLSPAGDTIITGTTASVSKTCQAFSSVPPLHSVIDSESTWPFWPSTPFSIPCCGCRTDFHSFLDKFFAPGKKIGHGDRLEGKFMAEAGVFALSVFAYLSRRFQVYGPRFTSLDGPERASGAYHIQTGIILFNTHDTTTLRETGCWFQRRRFQSRSFRQLLSCSAKEKPGYQLCQ